MRAILIAAALLLAASGVQAGEDSPPTTGAPSVADMLQRKQEHQLREQLAREGRWDEIKKMDEDKARRLHEQLEKAYLKVNQQLSRSGNVDGPVSTINNACEADSLGMKKMQPAKQGNNAAGSSGY